MSRLSYKEWQENLLLREFQTVQVVTPFTKPRIPPSFLPVCVGGEPEKNRIVYIPSDVPQEERMRRAEEYLKLIDQDMAFCRPPEPTAPRTSCSGSALFVFLLMALIFTFIGMCVQYVFGVLG